MRLPVNAMSGLAGALLAVAIAPTLAVAGDWKLSDSVTASATVIDRTGDNSSSGTVFQLSPRLRLNGRGARASADLNYALTASTGTGDTNPQPLAHSLLARGQLEAIEDFFFIGASASARLTGTSSTSGPVDAINAKSDGVQSYSFRVTPEFRHHLNRYADIVSRNSFDYVTYGGDNSSGRDSSRSYTTNIGVRSGRYFGPLNWSLDATQRTTKYDQRDDKNTSYIAGLGYRIDSHWRVNGRAGYETNDVQSNRNDTDGVTWSVGGDWTPNPRTSVSAQYGERYLGETYSARINHRTRRTTMSMDLSRDISNRRTAQLVDSFFFLVDDAGNIIVDPATGDPIIVNIPELDQIDEDFINTQLRGVVSVTGRRTTLTLTGNVAHREYEVSSEEQDSYGLSLSVSRQLGASFSGSVAGRYSHSDSSGGGDSDTYDLSMSLSRRLSPRTSASLSVSHRDRDSSTTNGGYTENRIGISITSSFL